jgi:hypothetical protein
MTAKPVASLARARTMVCRPRSARYQSTPVKCWTMPYTAATRPASTTRRASRAACAASRSHQKTAKYATTTHARDQPVASSGRPLATVESARIA